MLLSGVVVLGGWLLARALLLRALPRGLGELGEDTGHDGVRGGRG